MIFKVSMKIICKFLALITAISICFSFYGCTNNGDVVELYYFNTVIHIETHDKSISKDTLKNIEDTLLSLENHFDLDCENGFISTFNRAESGAIKNLTNEELEVFLASNTAYEITNGLFNPTIYPLVKLWGFSPYKFTAGFTPPTEKEINSLLPYCNYNSILLDIENKTLTKTDKNVQLDFGGLVKGYASDKIANILLSSGHNSGYVNIGGSSLTLLSVSSLGIRHPLKAGESLLSVNVSEKTNLSISTSGDYEKFHLDSLGNKYCHLINPKTGYPTNTGLRSATLLGIDGIISDALTTALCLYEYKSKELTDFLTLITERYPDCMYFLIYDKDGEKEILTNKKQGEDFTLQDNEYIVVNLD